jgi:hypothetical protein
LGEKVVKGAELAFLYSKYENSIDETENTVHRFIRLITLNGHILSPFLFHKDAKLTDKGYEIAPIHGYRPINIFKTIAIAVEIFIKFPKIKQLYKDTLRELTNQAIWNTLKQVFQKLPSNICNF